jgi:ribose/xylose/arabinose/galactoside ABC-type transport system permease subunit
MNSSETSTRSSAAVHGGPKRRARIDRRRLIDLFGFLALPLLFVLRIKDATVVGAIVLGIAGVAFYFFPEATSPRRARWRGNAQRAEHEADRTSTAVELSTILAVPVVFFSVLLYLVWVGHVLTRLELVAAIIALIVGVILVSAFILTRRRKPLGKANVEPFTVVSGAFLCLWLASFFVLVVLVGCLVLNLIEHGWSTEPEKHPVTAPTQTGPLEMP